MRVAVASDDGKTIASHLGRANGFIVYEIDDAGAKHEEYRANSSAGGCRGEHGEDRAHRHRRILSSLDGFRAVISRGMGRSIREELRAVGCEAFVVDEMQPAEALGLYLMGVLEDGAGAECDHAGVHAREE